MDFILQAVGFIVNKSVEYPQFVHGHPRTVRTASTGSPITRCRCFDEPLAGIELLELVKNAAISRDYEGIVRQLPC